MAIYGVYRHRMSARATSFMPLGPLRSMVFVLALMGLLGHIVPLPFSGHSPFTTSTESHAPSGSGPEASHVASCDATTAPTAPTVPAPAATIAVAAQPMSLVPCSTPMATLAAAARSSRDHTGAPLFLLHASFLI